VSQGDDVSNEPKPGDKPQPGPKGPRTSYPVEHPGIRDQPGSEPDVLPGTRPESLPKL
jgi:hypothetical protein